MMCANVESGPSPAAAEKATSEKHVTWLNQRKVKSFYSGVMSSDLRSGVNMLMQGAGLGRMKPNVLLLGFKKSWRSDSPQDAHDYAGILHDAFELQYGVCLLRMKEGLDISDPPQSHVNHAFDEGPESVHSTISRAHLRTSTISAISSSPELQPTTMFQKKQAKKTIDVYWLCDDGGLILLLPYLLTRRKRWSKCKVRVFVGGQPEKKEEQRQEVLALIKKFRLGFHDVEVLPDVYQSPQPMNVQLFENMVAQYRTDINPKQDSGCGPTRIPDGPWMITEQDWERNKAKTFRQIRLNEVLQDYSREAALILVTMPVGRRGVCPSALYLAWLDFMSRELRPPILLVRGNQENVLTFYCQ